MASKNTKYTAESCTYNAVQHYKSAFACLCRVRFKPKCLVFLFGLTVDLVDHVCLKWTQILPNACIFVSRWVHIQRVPSFYTSCIY